jgi:hypothetical protein
MRKLRMVLALTLALIFSLSLMATSFAADTYYYRCNGHVAGTYQVSQHDYNGNECVVRMQQCYCSLYRNNVSISDTQHQHDHLRYHSNSQCPATPQKVCSHGSNHF